ncbi:MAG: hypothetical protein ACXW1U_20200 [Methylobacter sp.]
MSKLGIIEWCQELPGFNGVALIDQYFGQTLLDARTDGGFDPRLQRVPVPMISLRNSPRVAVYVITEIGLNLSLYTTKAKTTSERLNQIRWLGLRFLMIDTKFLDCEYCKMSAASSTASYV